MATSLIRPLVRRVGHAVLAGATAVSAIRRLHAATKPTVGPSPSKVKARKKESSILKRRAAKTVKIRPVKSTPNAKPTAAKPKGKAKPRIIPGTPRPTKAQRSQGTVLNAAIKKIKSMRAPTRYTNSGKVIR